MKNLMNGYITTYNDRMYTFVLVLLSMTISILFIGLALFSNGL